MMNAHVFGLCAFAYPDPAAAPVAEQMWAHYVLPPPAWPSGVYFGDAGGGVGTYTLL